MNLNQKTSQPSTGDVLDAVLAASPGTIVHDLRRLRDKVHAATQGSYDALFDPASTELSLQERLWVAHYAAHWAGAAALAAHYGERLVQGGFAQESELAVIDRTAPITVTGNGDDLINGSAGGGTSNTAQSDRLANLLTYTRTLTLRPIDGGRASLDALTGAGLSTRAIVALGQLIAYLSYQIRAEAGLRALSRLESAS